MKLGHRNLQKHNQSSTGAHFLAPRILAKTRIQTETEREGER
jgi:hypothetical protein